ncbi:MAG: hypothetical protein N2V75_04010 [Methanophagales archaeon]|nr:hypothetical protein [Methanophagales archaeon]
MASSRVVKVKKAKRRRLLARAAASAPAPAPTPAPTTGPVTRGEEELPIMGTEL